MEKQSVKYKLTALCGDCGEFEVIRPRKPLKSTSGHVYYHPQSLVCPSCHKWAKVVSAKEVA